SWHQFAQRIKDLAHFSCRVKPLTTAEYPTPVARPAYSVLNTQKIQQVYGIAVKDWQQSLQTCLAKLQPATGN
ncbi:MAG TPA: sugar nucleotide-binding protein, partial [Chitinophagaceae bacterium]|nr:sugar nucleotide-binding protein [Chitinophagaceae bacterium]